MLKSRLTIKRACRGSEDALFKIPFDEVLETVRDKFVKSYFKKTAYKKGANNETFTEDIDAVLTPLMKDGADAFAASYTILKGLIARDLMHSVAISATERRRREARASKDSKTTGIMLHPVKLLNKKGATVTKVFKNVEPEILSVIYSSSRRSALTHMQSNNEVWGRYADVNKVATEKETLTYISLGTVADSTPETPLKPTNKPSTSGITTITRKGVKTPETKKDNKWGTTLNKSPKAPFGKPRKPTKKPKKPIDPKGSNPGHGFISSTRKKGKTSRRK